ncbi:MAG TPA: DNA repair protein RecO [Rhizobacter sp.]|nr:DNA repair protein RecO [Rhizobacter sp.]
MATRAPRASAALAAYVLHRYDWSESSLILDLFTREQGRLTVVAKGAKRPYSQLRPVLLPFQRIHVSLGRVPKAGASDEPAGDIQTLRAAEWAGGAAMLTGAALFSGFYLNELLMKLLARHDPHVELFDAYAQTLPLLGASEEAAVQSALRAFELSLLMHIGVLPDLSRVTLTLEPVREDVDYTLLAEAGVGAMRAGEGTVTGDILVGLQAALVHGSLPALQQACARNLPAIRGLLRGLLHYHLGSNVLRTRQVMLDVQTLER